MPVPYIAVARLIAIVQQGLVPRKFAMTVEVFDSLDEAIAWIEARQPRTAS